MTLNLISVAEFSVNMVNTLNKTLGIWYLVILNAFGVMAMISKLFEYQVKGRSTMLVVAIIANICWVLYFFFYGDLMSSLTCGINVIRMILFAQREKFKWAKSNLWLYFFLAVQTIVAIFTFKGWIDIFVLIAGYSAVFAYFVINQKAYRLISLLYIIMWVINDSIKFFPVSMVSDSISTISILIAIYRYDISPRRNKVVERAITEQPAEQITEQTK